MTLNKTLFSFYRRTPSTPGREPGSAAAPPKIGHFVVFVVNFDQLRDRVAITTYQDQCERLEKTRIRKSPLKLKHGS
jgi:hypothetical protein